MTEQPESHTDIESRGTASIATVAPPVLLFILALAVFWPNLVWLVQTWTADEFYNHGFLIPLISGYLVYRKWHRLGSLPRTGHGWGVALIVASVCLHLVATYLDVNFVSTFALIGVLAGLVWWLWGWQVFDEVAFPFGFLVFMVPLGKLLIDQVAQPMQVVGAKLAGGAAQFLGMPVAIDGITLSTPEYTFEVAIACSGLKSAIAMLALGALLAFLVKGAWWQRIIIFASALPVAILANAVRIWLTLIMGRSLGEKAAEGFFHTFSGALVFLLAFLGLFGVTSLLQCRQLRDDI